MGHTENNKLKIYQLKQLKPKEQFIVQWMLTYVYLKKKIGSRKEMSAFYML